MKQHSQIPQHIIDLALTHSFDELSTAQQQEVLQNLSRAEYNEWHNTHKATHEALATGTTAQAMQPDARLMQAFRQKYQKPSAAIRVPLGYRMQLWQAAALVVVAFVAGMLIKTRQAPIEKEIVYVDSSTHRPQPATVTNTLHDTIFVEKETVRQPIAQNSASPKHRRQTHQAATALPSTNDEPLMPNKAVMATIKSGTQNKGRSLASDDLAAVFSHSSM